MPGFSTNALDDAKRLNDRAAATFQDGDGGRENKYVRDTVLLATLVILPRV